MKRQDREKNRPESQPRAEDRDSRERAVAPPIEREHETQEGVFEEDEKREHERH